MTHDEGSMICYEIVRLALRWLGSGWVGSARFGWVGLGSVSTVKTWGVLTVKTWGVLTVKTWGVLTVKTWGVLTVRHGVSCLDSQDLGCVNSQDVGCLDSQDVGCLDSQDVGCLETLDNEGMLHIEAMRIWSYFETMRVRCILGGHEGMAKRRFVSGWFAKYLRAAGFAGAPYIPN
eukprot:1393241-Amorphochlora_amoeboformis.AAC.2